MSRGRKAPIYLPYTPLLTLLHPLPPSLPPPLPLLHQHPRQGVGPLDVMLNPYATSTGWSPRACRTTIKPGEADFSAAAGRTLHRRYERQSTPLASLLVHAAAPPPLPPRGAQHAAEAAYATALGCGSRPTARLRRSAAALLPGVSALRPTLIEPQHTRATRISSPRCASTLLPLPELALASPSLQEGGWAHKRESATRCCLSWNCVAPPLVAAALDQESSLDASLTESSTIARAALRRDSLFHSEFERLAARTRLHYSTTCCSVDGCSGER